jgi:hypothetical protein
VDGTRKGLQQEQKGEDNLHGESLTNGTISGYSYSLPHDERKGSEKADTVLSSEQDRRGEMASLDGK